MFWFLVCVLMTLLIWPFFLVYVSLICVLRTCTPKKKRVHPPHEAELVSYTRLSVKAQGDAAGPGEVVDNLLDEDTRTDVPPWFTSKWNHHHGNGKPTWLEISVDGPPLAIGRYALRSANDCPSRDPREWTLSGIDKHGKAHTLHKVCNGAWQGRWVWNEYSLDPNGGDIYGRASAFNMDGPTAFNKFRIDITSNGGDGCTQLGQLKLYQRPEVDP